MMAMDFLKVHFLSLMFVMCSVRLGLYHANIILKIMNYWCSILSLLI